MDNFTINAYNIYLRLKWYKNYAKIGYSDRVTVEHKMVRSYGPQCIMCHKLWKAIKLNQWGRKPESAAPHSERQPMRPQIFRQFSDDLYSRLPQTRLFSPHTPANSSLWAPFSSPFSYHPSFAPANKVFHYQPGPFLVWILSWNIIRTAPCWVVWHNVHSQQHTHVSSSCRSSRLGLSHWDPYTMHTGGCLELYYCNMVEWYW